VSSYRAAIVLPSRKAVHMQVGPGGAITISGCELSNCRRRRTGSYIPPLITRSRAAPLPAGCPANRACCMGSPVHHDAA